jgi:putative nucleotidyltransferase with HDIG domain
MQKKILVVDDESKIIQILTKGLTQSGFRVKSTTNGKDALKKLKTELFDAIISDINMPQMDGLTFLTEIKQVFPEIPFLIITAFMDVMDSKEALELGADEVIMKPFKVGDIAEKVKAVIEDHEAAEDQGGVPSYKCKDLDPQFKRVSVNAVIDGDFKDKNRFIRLNNRKFVIIFNAEESVDVPRLKHYQSKGLDAMYLLLDDFKEAITQQSEDRKNFVKKQDKVTTEEKVEFASRCNSIIFDQMQHEDLDKEMLDHAKEAVADTVNLVTAVDETASLFKTLSDQEDFLHAHAVGTSVVASMLCKELGIVTPANRDNISLGAFLHDIGKTKLESRLYSTPIYQLTQSEQNELRDHPTTGYELIKEMSNIPDVVSQIVLQHHENCTGLGYPNKLASAKISKGAKIVSLASEFCHLTIKNPLYRYMSAKNAIRQLDKTKRQNFDKQVFQALRSIYKVY